MVFIPWDLPCIAVLYKTFICNVTTENAFKLWPIIYGEIDFLRECSRIQNLALLHQTLFCVFKSDQT